MATPTVEIKEPKGKLGVLLPGMGAVATTFIAGVESVRRELAKPIGSLTQMGTIRLGKRTDERAPLISEFVPLADLNNIVCGGWDVFPDNCYAAAKNAGVLEAGAGKVRLLKWDELDPGWDPAVDKRLTVWEATHHLIERLNTHGETGSAMLMQKMPSEMAAEARQLASRLYNICERKGWSEHARDYNSLVISWSGIGEETARLRQAAAQGDATQQIGLGGEFE